MSWNADVSLEWYANADSMLSTAVYYKQFNGGSVPVVVGENFDIDGVSVTVPVEQLATSDQKSDLIGFELTGSHSFSYLPGIFAGLGVKASYNYAHSNFKTEDLRTGESTDPSTGIVTRASWSRPTSSACPSTWPRRRCTGAGQAGPAGHLQVPLRLLPAVRRRPGAEPLRARQWLAGLPRHLQGEQAPVGLAVGQQPH